MRSIKNMNKLFLFIVSLSVMLSCTLDDNLEPIEDCYSCVNLSTVYCYNEGEDFYTSTNDGQVVEIALNNQTWEEIKVALDLNCTSSLGDYAVGYFIVNEGSFGAGIGTLSFVDSNGVVTNNVYQTVNGEPMGNLLQSMYFYNDNAYLVLNGSHKIIVANRYTMEKIAIIEGEGINNPRYFVAKGEKGYVSNWNDATDATDDFISIINLATNEVESTIAIGEGPEDMLINDDKLYVNLQGGFGQNNQVVIIDTTDNQVVNSLTVGDIPSAITVDKNNSIWVLCTGKASWTGNETLGKLIEIKNDEVSTTLEFDIAEHPEHLSINDTKDVFYYNLNGKVFRQQIEINTSSATEMPDFEGFYYGMSFNNNKLYTLDAGDFTSEGTLKIFDLNSEDTQTITTGIIPNSVIFQ